MSTMNGHSTMNKHKHISHKIRKKGYAMAGAHIPERSLNETSTSHSNCEITEESKNGSNSEDMLRSLGSKRKREIMLLLSLFISVFTIALLLNFSIDELTTVRINLLFFAAAVFMHFLALFIWSIRLKVLSDFVVSRRLRQRAGKTEKPGSTNARNVRMNAREDVMHERLKIRDSLKIVFASLFGACITPSQFGGEPIRIYLLSKRTLSIGESTVIVFGERVFDFFVVMIGAIFSVIFIYFVVEPALKPFFMVLCVSLIVIFSILSAVVLIGVDNPLKIRRAMDRVFGIVERFAARSRGHAIERFMERVQVELENFCSAISVIRDEGGVVVLKSFALSAALWSVDFCIPPLIMLSLYSDPAWIPSFAAQFILLILVSIPLTPGSSGVAEFGFTHIYKIIGIHVDAVFTLLWRLIVYYMNLILGGISSTIFLREHARRR